MNREKDWRSDSMSDDITKNYHSRLLAMSKAFDKPLERIKASYIDERYSNWITWLLMSPVREYKRVMKVHEGLKKFSAETLTALLVPATGIGAILYQSTLSRIDHFVDLVGVTALGLISGYVFSVIVFLSYLLNFNSPHFHTGAYRKFRRQEYDMFKRALLDEQGDFYFQGVYDYFGKMQAGNEEITGLSDKITKYFEKDKVQVELKYRLIRGLYDRQEKRNEEETNKIIREYETLIEVYDATIKEASRGTEYIIELIKDINNVLFRMRNGVFTTKDLNLICGFTLYEQRGNKIHKLEDVGTSGRSPKVIELEDPEYKNWGAVEVIKKDMKEPVINEPYENHTVVSLKMNIDRTKQWVYNFHFDTDNKKVNHLLVKNDIIDSREVYRLIHALSLVAEGVEYGAQKEANERG
ncbi:hypothetical protein QTG56_25785 (plasmid) [Rossellomorea sp. AcN35-11]|nr:hypothetical protein [Rossellomorea aquimaris]WJV32028.1 hypothetical protein QTG56_25785 [Rossellomorea sp. AcN35-11]